MEKDLGGGQQDPRGETRLRTSRTIGHDSNGRRFLARSPPAQTGASLSWVPCAHRSRAQSRPRSHASTPTEGVGALGGWGGWGGSLRLGSRYASGRTTLITRWRRITRQTSLITSRGPQPGRRSCLIAVAGLGAKLGQVVPCWRQLRVPLYLFTRAGCRLFFPDTRVFS